MMMKQRDSRRSEEMRLLVFIVQQAPILGAKPVSVVGSSESWSWLLLVAESTPQHALLIHDLHKVLVASMYLCIRNFVLGCLPRWQPWPS
jgi:hypothetical protein